MMVPLVVDRDDMIDLFADAALQLHVNGEIDYDELHPEEYNMTQSAMVHLINTNMELIDGIADDIPDIVRAEIRREMDNIDDDE